MRLSHCKIRVRNQKGRKGQGEQPGAKVYVGGWGGVNLESHEGVSPQEAPGQKEKVTVRRKIDLKDEKKKIGVKIS